MSKVIDIANSKLNDAREQIKFTKKLLDNSYKQLCYLHDAYVVVGHKTDRFNENWFDNQDQKTLRDHLKELDNVVYCAEVTVTDTQQAHEHLEHLKDLLSEAHSYLSYIYDVYVVVWDEYYSDDPASNNDQLLPVERDILSYNIAVLRDFLNLDDYSVKWAEPE